MSQTVVVHYKHVSRHEGSVRSVTLRYSQAGQSTAAAGLHLKYAGSRNGNGIERRKSRSRKRNATQPREGICASRPSRAALVAADLGPPPSPPKAKDLDGSGTEMHRDIAFPGAIPRDVKTACYREVSLDLTLSTNVMTRLSISSSSLPEQRREAWVVVVRVAGAGVRRLAGLILPSMGGSV